jgi:hypothetical protein
MIGPVRRVAGAERGAIDRISGCAPPIELRGAIFPAGARGVFPGADFLAVPGRVFFATATFARRS